MSHNKNKDTTTHLMNMEKMLNCNMYLFLTLGFVAAVDAVAAISAAEAVADDDNYWVVEFSPSWCLQVAVGSSAPR